tara:strand:- start:10363 stop:11799 length:1437 start_codon:yes stop_codon:yes gene_type:complete
LANFEDSGQPITTDEELVVVSKTTEPEQDDAIMDLLATALAAEQSSQDQLRQELEEAMAQRDALESNRSELSEELKEKEQAIAEREKMLAEREELLAEARAEAERAAREREATEEQAAALEAERDRIAAEQQEAAAKAATLAATVEKLSSQANVSAEELQKRNETLARLEAELSDRSRKLAEAERRQSEIETERRRLANEVATAEREKELLSTTLETAQQTISVERQEKEQLRKQTETLTEGVSRLAEASSEITKEVQNLRPMTTNEIYQEVSSNRVEIQFTGTRSGLFGDKEFEETVETALTRINGRPFLWIHISQTPFADADRRKFINSLDVYLQANDARFRVPQFGVLQQDRSLLFLPLSEEIVERLQTKTFTSTDKPFRFEDMVVVDLPDSRYGESSFRIDSKNPGHLEIDSRVFSSLFGEFSPSAGNIAFTRTGDFLGIVTGSGEAWMAEPVKTGGRISFGKDFSRAQLQNLP